MKSCDMDELRKIISNEVFFTNEAAKYLGISPQRLHQLVQSGKLSPVKVNKSGSLFLKSDLDERKREMETFNFSNEETLRFNNDPKIINEAINYFTVHYLNKHSESKTRNIFSELSLYLDVTDPFPNQLEEACRLLSTSPDKLLNAYNEVALGFDKLKDSDYVVKLGQDPYPEMLAKTENAPLFLFMRGNVHILQYPVISIVGTRNPSTDGIRKASYLASVLGKLRIVVASGLAKGIDTAAHEGALSENTPTIGVIGTPLTKAYPNENAKLQEEIASKYLIISQFAPSTPVQRWNFPARNAVMSGISIATVIIEAGETSGALIQANYALKQGRLVFIPQSALNDSRLNWPKKYIKKPGAFSFSKIDELLESLQKTNLIESEVGTKTFTIGDNYVHRS